MEEKPKKKSQAPDEAPTITVQTRNGPTTLRPFIKGDPRIVPGRRKGTKTLSVHIQEMLEDDDFEVKLKDGTVMQGRPIDAIIKVAIIKAAKGDLKAFDILGKYGYGTKVDITSGGKELPRPIIPLDGDNLVQDSVEEE